MALESIVSFTGGEWSDKMAGRVDLSTYRTACRTLENFIVLPQGPAQIRPGTRFVSYCGQDTDTWMIPFISSDSNAYIFEFIDLGILIYKINPVTGIAEQVMSGGSPVKLTTLYLATDAPLIRFAQANDTMYLVHNNIYPYKIVRGSDTVWSFTPLDFDIPPVIEKQDFHNCDVSLSFTDEGQWARVSRTTGPITNPFLASDLNKEFIAGTGRGIVVAVPSTTVLIIKIVSAFNDISYSSGNWYLQGSPFALAQVMDVGGIGYFAPNYQAMVIGGTVYNIDFAVALNLPAGWWTQSSTPTEYYLTNSNPAWITLNGYGGGSLGPAFVQLNGVAMAVGAVGALASGAWGFGDNDALGYNTVYVNIGFDPDILSLNPNALQFWYTNTKAVFKPIDIGRYIEIGEGLIQITDFIDAACVSGTVIKQVKTATSGIPKVSQIAFDDNRGYPSQVTFHQNRLVLGATAAYPRTLWFSESNNYESFAIGANDGDGISATLADTGTNNIRWILSRANDLLVGTDAGEWILTSNGGVITPSDIGAKIQTSYGGEQIQPIIKDGNIVFVQKMGRKLRAITYEFASNGYVAPDLNILAEHIFKSGIKQMTYQQMPLGTIWILRNDGVLVGMDYDRNTGQLCFHRHTTDGTVQSIAVIPHPTDARDVLFMAVKRSVNGSDKLMVETMEPYFDEDRTLTNCWYLDSAVDYDGVATTTLTSAHLALQDVAVIDRTDGQYLGEYTADSTGTITLADSVTKALYGLKYTGTILTNRLANSNRAAWAQAQYKQITSSYVRVWNTEYLRLGVSTATLQDVLFRETGMNTDEPIPLFTGDKLVSINAGHDLDGSMMIVVDKPYPCTIQAIYPDVNYRTAPTGQ